jgi:hypothetical protein
LAHFELFDPLDGGLDKLGRAHLALADRTFAPKRGKVEDVLCAGTIEEDDNKLGQVVTNMALMSLKRLAERQAVIKTGTSWNAV